MRIGRNSPISGHVVGVRFRRLGFHGGGLLSGEIMGRGIVFLVGGFSVCLMLAAGGSLDSRVDLAAASAMDELAGAVETVVKEYHGEIDRGDDAMEAAVVDAFVARVRRDVSDDALVDSHSEAFRSAMQRVRDDRAVEMNRYRAALDNVDLVREVARGLRRLATESMSFEDDARRYLFSLLESASSGATTPGT